MAGPNHLEDYAEVKERIAVFYDRHPEGNLATASVEFVSAGDVAGVLVRAYAWRKPDDAQPASGTGWCPIPGKTGFERDREVQNAETSAWGRTLEAAGIPRKRSALIDADALATTSIDTGTARELDLAYRGLAKAAGADYAKAETNRILSLHKVERFGDLTMAAAVDVLARIEQARLDAAQPGVPA